MNMILNPLSDVVILLCLASDPSACERHVIPLEVSLVECITMPAPPVRVARFLQSHREWTIEDIQCRQHALDL